MPEIQTARSARAGTSLVRDRTSFADREITSLCSHHFDISEPDWAIIALGGYGRMDLCPHSDLDILLLVEKHTPYREIRSVLEEVLYPLWDVGFHASYSVRTIRQAVSDARKDFFFRTSLFDARHIWGSEECLNALRDALIHDRVLSNGKKFFQDLIFHTRKRHEKYGDTAYILEPDLKEGLGGLRDYHSILWGRKVLEEQNLSGSLDHILDERDTEQLFLAVYSIVRIRYALHEITGRKNDRVYIEYQDPLAQALGFVDNGIESPSELLMRTYHRSALVIKTLSELLLSTAEHSLGLSSLRKNRVVDPHFTIISGQLTVSSRDDLKQKPFLLVQIFKHIALQNAIISPSARVMLKNTPDLVEMARHDHRAKVCFLSLLRLRDNKKSLTSMLELGVLEGFIPEFSSIKGRTQPDPYHTYTTDLHSINTVAELTSLELEEKDLFRKIDDPDVLYLSALLHDIGKGFGRPHADTGAPVACRIARQFDMTEDRAELVGFLVRNHLLLANLAVKRDLSEERVAMECARCVGDAQRLTMLYLLTVADSRATGPGAWNQWRAALIRELFSKVLHVLETGIFKDPEAGIALEKKWGQLIEEVPLDIGPSHAGRLWALPQAYILHSEVSDIKSHIALSSHILAHDDIKLDVRQEGEHVVLSVIARDRPGLFALLTGILAINKLEIMSAKVFTWLDGIAVDVFTLIPAWKNFQEWDRVEQQFRQASSGSLDIEKRLASIRIPKHKTSGNTRRMPTVIIDNEYSDFFSLIEVTSPKKFALLHRVATIITEFHLDIHRAFVSHSADPSSDVFYVVDESGEKITDTGIMKDLITNIRDAVSG